MYSFILFIHSWLRWVVLGVLVIAFIRSLIGWLKRDTYCPGDEKLRLWSVILYDLQILIGVYLYTFLSPTVRSALQYMAEAMKDSQVRFFIVEHAFGMLVGVVAIHIGNALSKKAPTGTKKHKIMAITLLVVFVITMLSIPWPGLPYGRVLFRGF